MMERLKEAINRVADIKIYEPIRKNLTKEDIEALEVLCNFAALAIESEGKWPGKMDENSPSALAVRRMGYVGRSEGFNEAIDLCLAAHAFEKARWKEKLLTEEELAVIMFNAGQLYKNGEGASETWDIKDQVFKKDSLESAPADIKDFIKYVSNDIRAVQQKKAEGKYA